MRYDADLAPDPAEWLALDEERRLAAVRAHHRGRVLRLHAKDFNVRLHAAMHAIIENQAAADDPPVTRETLERLVALGLRRHAAVHAVGDAMMRGLARGQAYDAEAYARDLRAVDPSEWLAAQMRRDFAGDDR